MTHAMDACWGWQSALSCPQPVLNHWLQDTGSLTARLRLCCDRFRVQLLKTTAQVALTPEQAGWLGETQAYCREVLLLCDHVPWIYASSLYSSAALDAVPALGGLGQRALGELLFEHPQLVRSHFEFAQLTSSEWQRLTQYLSSPDQPPLFASASTPFLPWARRSLLATPDASVLVSELFLPNAQAYQRE